MPRPGVGRPFGQRHPGNSSGWDSSQNGGLSQRRRTRPIHARGCAEILFLSIESRKSSFEIAEQVGELVPGTQIVAVNRTCDPPTLLETMQAGIREFLSPPFEPKLLNEALKRIGEKISQNPPLIESTDSVFAFLPAKAGCGATTIAVNASLALTKITEKGVLLADLDLNSGLVGFMLRLTDSIYSIVDAAENALDLDENLWPKLVSSKDSLDVLPVGRLSPGFRIETTQIRNIPRLRAAALLGYLRRPFRHDGAIFRRDPARSQARLPGHHGRASCRCILPGRSWRFCAVRISTAASASF